MQEIIRINDGVARHPQHRMRKPINLVLAAGEQLAIVGPNGGGKTELVHTLMGKYPLLMNQVEYDFSPRSSSMVFENVCYIAFQDTCCDVEKNNYYQQRWNSEEVEQFPPVRELLPRANDPEWSERLFKLFGIEALLDKSVILLSSGETRKYQLAKALLNHPRLLIMDNPFIGLDVDTRTSLQGLLTELVRTTDLQIILVLSKTDDLPDFITHVVEVREMTCGMKMTREEFQRSLSPVVSSVLPEAMRARILEWPEQTNDIVSDEVIDLRNVSIRYGERTILKGLDWRVMSGERWALLGENGAGKSTLLSLVCADNPQSYSCDFSLFGRKRGSGESIWEIKKHIGYVSPEMHRSYLKRLPAVDIVASGLHDTVGLYKRNTPEQRAVCEQWMEIFGIRHLAERDFLTLSSGEQRLALLARAFVKDPQLLILDEPFHGLDMYNRQRAKEIIETFCLRRGKTLVMVTHYPEELPSVITHSLRLKKN